MDDVRSIIKFIETIDTKKKKLEKFLKEINEVADLLKVNSQISFITKENYELLYSQPQSIRVYDGDYCKILIKDGVYNVFIADSI